MLRGKTGYWRSVLYCTILYVLYYGVGTTLTTTELMHYCTTVVLNYCTIALELHYTTCTVIPYSSVLYYNVQYCTLLELYRYCIYTVVRKVGGRRRFITFGEISTVVYTLSTTAEYLYLSTCRWI